MKRIIALTLCVLLAFSSVSYTLAADADNTYEVERALGILNAIGQFSEYDMTTLDITKGVTRGEFAQGIADILKLTPASEELYYHDVSKEHYAYKGITALTEIGYTSGCGNNLFEPERIMTVNEAAIVLVSALGYKPEAVVKGGTEYEYVKIADRLELFEGVSSRADLTFGDMLVMFASSLTAPILEGYIYGDEIAYRESEDTTLLSTYYNSYYAEMERVTYTNNTGIYAETEHKDIIIIGGKRYFSGNENMEMYLGSFVNFIYKGNPDKEVCEIIWIEKNINFDELILDGEQVLSFDSTNYLYNYYNEYGTERSVPLSRNISVIYNGRFESNSTEFLNKPCTEIKFIENENNIYDVAIISCYENYVIDSVYSTNDFFTIKGSGETVNIKEDDYEKFIVLDANGEIKSKDDLVSDQTVSIFKSSDGKYIKLVLSDAVAEGAVESIKKASDNLTEITIGGNVYNPSKSFDVTQLKLGTTVFIYLDFNGKIAYVKQNYSSAYMAYITDISANGVFSVITKIKAFNQDGEFAIYETADKFKVDGVPYRDPQQSEVSDIENSVIEQLVILEFNGDGKITSIDTTAGEGDLEILAPFESSYYRSVSPKIGRKTIIDSSTKIFAVPDNAAAAEEYEFRIMTKSQLGDWREFNAQSYQYSEDTAYAGAVLIQGFEWNSPTNTAVAFVFGEAYGAINEDGETVTVLHGIEGSTVKDYYCKKGYTPTGLTAGSGVFLICNGRGEVFDIQSVFNRDSAGGESDTYIAAPSRIVTGYVSQKQGNVISIGYTDPTVVDERFDCTGTPIIVVDETKGEKVSIGSVADITSYENSTTEYSKVCIQTIQMNQKMIVVYK